MSEFKKGDILVNQTAVNSGLVELLYEHKHYFHGFSKDFGIITIAKKKLDRYRKATEAEKQIGHRIDMPSLPEPVGSLQELHPEFAKVLHENFLELLGDDSHIENRICRIDKPSDSGELETLDKPENHISPNCEVKNG